MTNSKMTVRADCAIMHVARPSPSPIYQLYHSDKLVNKPLFPPLENYNNIAEIISLLWLLNQMESVKQQALNICYIFSIS